eukprot:scaffold55825_cov27-Tisochrysis_lutea.AAC.5
MALASARRNAAPRAPTASAWGASRTVSSVIAPTFTASLKWPSATTRSTPQMSHRTMTSWNSARQAVASTADSDSVGKPSAPSTREASACVAFSGRASAAPSAAAAAESAAIGRDVQASGSV